MSTMSAAGSGDMGTAATSMAAIRAKVGAWAGIAFAVLTAASVFIAPIPPKASDPVDKITNYFADHRAVLLTAQYIGGLGLIALLVFIGSFAALLRAMEGERGTLAVGAVGGAFITGALAMAGSAIMMALAFTGRDGDAATTRVFFNLFQSVSAFIQFSLVAWVVLASLILLGSAGALRWIAYLGLLEGVLGLLTGASVAKSGLFALGGILGFFAFIVFILWILAVSIVMLRGK